MKTADQIKAEIEMTIKYGMDIPATKTFASERKACAMRIEFLQECLRITQILGVDSIKSQHEKVLEKIRKYELAIQEANQIGSKLLRSQATKAVVDHFIPSQLNKQQGILEYINAD